MVIRLHQDKLTRLRNLIGEWKGRKICCKRQLLSLIGQLQHACKVASAAGALVPQTPDRPVNGSVRNCITGYGLTVDSNLTFCGGTRSSRSGMACVDDEKSPRWHSGGHSNVGCVRGVGRRCIYKQWRVVPAPMAIESWSFVHIKVKELAPIVVACAVWGRQWQGSSVRCRCDNAAVVAVVRAGSSKHPLAMHLLRCLSFLLHFPAVSRHCPPPREVQ